MLTIRSYKRLRTPVLLGRTMLTNLLMMTVFPIILVKYVSMLHLIVRAEHYIQLRAWMTPFCRYLVLNQRIGQMKMS